MIYDCIIAGGGISGCVCAYLLSRKNIKCIILEKNHVLQEKICGGGVPRRALDLLEQIGMDTRELLSDDVSMIHGHRIDRNGCEHVHLYPEADFALGMQRRILDGYLLKQALNQGSQIRFGTKVSNAVYRNGLYHVNGYQGSRFVCAVGARGLGEQVPKGQSIGISAQISGESSLPSTFFYFKYYTDSDERYFWMFPIGVKRWNIGVWYRVPAPAMAQDYRTKLLDWITNYFPSGYQVISKPQAEFLGNVDQRSLYGNDLDGIGDFAGTNNLKNGGGIMQAIHSAIDFANDF